MAYNHQLTDDEKRELLRIARATLREFLRTGRIPPGRPHRESLLAAAAAFVTLHRHEQLRGCIGTQQESQPLYRTVQEMAVAAASRDPRFEEVGEDEIEEVRIEISVLGNRSPVSHPADITIGIHGLILETENRRGLLLPQVATENDWNAETFLENVCLKAGLPGDTWRQRDARVELFTAQVFSEITHPADR